MDDLSEKLSSLLSDPGSVEQLKGMAQSLLSGMGSGGEAGSSNPPTDGLSAGDLQTITKVMGLLRSQGGEDQRTRLLVALRPYVPQERRERIDQAVKMLRLVSVLPMLTSSGIL